MHSGFARIVDLDGDVYQVGKRDEPNSRIIIDIRVERYEPHIIDFVLWLRNDDETMSYMYYSYCGVYQIYWGTREYDSNTDSYRGHTTEEAWIELEN